MDQTVRVVADVPAPPPPRRERRPLTLAGYATRGDGSVVEITVVDLSYDGCGVLCGAELAAGERLDLSVARRGMTRAVVRWAVGGKAGLAFAIDEPGEGPRLQPRGHERVSVEGEVAMRRAGKLSFRVHIYDLSSEGCKAEFIERPEVHEQLWIKFDGIEALEADVRWIVGQKVGLKFARTIHPAVFDLLLTRLRAQGR